MPTPTTCTFWLTALSLGWSVLRLCVDCASQRRSTMAQGDKIHWPKISGTGGYATQRGMPEEKENVPAALRGLRQALSSAGLEGSAALASAAAWRRVWRYSPGATPVHFLKAR